MKSYLSFFLSCLLVVSNAVAKDDPLSLRTFAGEEVSIDQYAGQDKWLLVMIWSTDCSVCFKEMPGIAKFHTGHEDIDAKVLGVALDGYDNREAVAAFAERYSLSFPNLIAEMPAFALRYEFEVGESLRGTPTYLLFNPAGELVANNPGPLRPVAVEQFMAR